MLFSYLRHSFTFMLNSIYFLQVFKKFWVESVGYQ